MSNVRIANKGIGGIRCYGKRRSYGLVLWPLVAAAAMALPAAAHPVAHTTDGFVAGLAHPLGGFDHLLAMVATGIWGGVLGRPLIYELPVIFPAVMVVGAVTAMLGLQVLPVETGIALSVVTLGACIAFAFRARSSVAWTIVAVFGLCHGYAHGRELPSAADPFGYSLGFVLATGLLHVVGIGIGTLHRHNWGRLAMRCLGSAISIAGVCYLYGAIR